VARLCARLGVPHIINNAYGVQCRALCAAITAAARRGRVDAVVQSSDKNFMVPVGGALVCGPARAYAPPAAGGGGGGGRAAGGQQRRRPEQQQQEPQEGVEGEGGSDRKGRAAGSPGQGGGAAEPGGSGGAAEPGGSGGGSGGRAGDWLVAAMAKAYPGGGPAVLTVLHWGGVHGRGRGRTGGGGGGGEGHCPCVLCALCSSRSHTCSPVNRSYCRL
jgi:hypothetical protein